MSRAIEQRLLPLGFDSFDHSWSEEQALTAAERRRPDLVVVGDAAERGSAIEAARRISSAHDVPVPVLMVRAKASRGPQVRGAEIEGPYPLEAIATAVRRVNRGTPSRDGT